MNGDGVSVGTKGSDLKSKRRDFPLALVEGQESIKTVSVMRSVDVVVIIMDFNQAPDRSCGLPVVVLEVIRA